MLFGDAKITCDGMFSKRAGFPKLRVVANQYTAIKSAIESRT